MIKWLRRAIVPVALVLVVVLVYYYGGIMKFNASIKTIQDFRKYGNSKMIAEVKYSGPEDILYSNGILHYTVHYGSVNVGPIVKFRLANGEYDDSLKILGILYNAEKDKFYVGDVNGNEIEVPEKYKPSLFD